MEVVGGEHDLMRPILGPEEPIINVQSLNVFHVKNPVVLWSLVNVVVGDEFDIGQFKAALEKTFLITRKNNNSKAYKLQTMKDLGPQDRGHCFTAHQKHGYVYVNVESATEHKDLKESVYRKAITPLVTLKLSAECSGGGTEETWRATSTMEKVCSLTARRLETMMEERVKHNELQQNTAPQRRRRKIKKVHDAIAKRKAFMAAKRKRRGVVKREAQ